MNVTFVSVNLVRGGAQLVAVKPVNFRKKITGEKRRRSRMMGDTTVTVPRKLVEKYRGVKILMFEADDMQEHMDEYLLLATEIADEAILNLSAAERKEDD